MKITTFLLLVIVTMNGCKKAGKMCCAPNYLVTTWEIRKSVGGYAGTLNYQPNNGNRLKFTDGNSFIHYQNWNVFQSGTYELQSTSEENKYTITFHTNAHEWSTTIILKPDTLVVLKFAPCCDIPEDTYVRLTPRQL